MRRHLAFCALGVLVIATSACAVDDATGTVQNNDPSPPTLDAGAGDAGSNNGSNNGSNDAGPPPAPGAFAIPTSGGGEASSEGLRLRLTVGAPQPHGQSASESYRLRLSPLAP